MSIRRKFIIAIIIMSFLGILDAGYLTMEHYSDSIPPCSTSLWVDCGKVLKSKYSMVGSIPLAVLGLAYYSSMFGLAAVRFAMDKEMTGKDFLWRLLEKYARPKSWSLEKTLFFVQFFLSSTGVLASMYFVYLQLGVIQAVCLYCMISAVMSIVMFGVLLTEYFQLEKKTI